MVPNQRRSKAEICCPLVFFASAQGGRGGGLLCLSGPLSCFLLVFLPQPHRPSDRRLCQKPPPPPSSYPSVTPPPAPGRTPGGGGGGGEKNQPRLTSTSRGPCLMIWVFIPPRVSPAAPGTSHAQADRDCRGTDWLSRKWSLASNILQCSYRTQTGVDMGHKRKRQHVTFNSR